MSRAEVLEKIRSIIANNDDLNTHIVPAEIQENSNFINDLGLDSIGLMSLIYELQDDYDHIDESHIAKFQQVSDLISAILQP